MKLNPNIVAEPHVQQPAQHESEEVENMPKLTYFVYIL
jgi:hypothetical protein